MTKTKLAPVKTIPVYALIIRATWERDVTQHEAIYELNSRGGWLSDEQKQQAGLTKEQYTVLCLTPPKSMPITEKHIEQALKRLNGQAGLSYPMIGFTYWADIKGDGRYRPSLYQIVNANGGVSSAYGMIGKTRRETVRLIAEACAKAGART